VTNEQFDAILRERLRTIEAVLGQKAKEYARGDRLHNFHRAAETLRCTPARALVGFWMKHVVSLLDMVDDLDKGIEWPIAAWDEKLGDTINYLVLLEAIVKDHEK
jgi:hypothetical protein